MAVAAIPISKAATAAYSDRDLALIRRTVAADTNTDEFNLFIHMARHLGLDPLRKQIYAFVFSKDDVKKRRMSVIVGIDGLRTIAARAGDYRPDEDEPEYEVDNQQRGETNPLGLVKATVRVWKHAYGDWHRITGSAYWEELAPLKEEWAWSDATRRKQPTGKRVLDPRSNWAKMPRVMLAKCAEAIALRKGWPDDLSNVYETSEIDRARAIDLPPSEAAEQGAAAERLRKLGLQKDTVPLTFDQLGSIEFVPLGQAADRCMAFLLEKRDEPSLIRQWAARNRLGLREFWAKAPNDALAVKKEIEKATA
jgi:phage recombination protein Bet